METAKKEPKHIKIYTSVNKLEDTVKKFYNLVDQVVGNLVDDSKKEQDPPSPSLSDFLNGEWERIEKANADLLTIKDRLVEMLF